MKSKKGSGTSFIEEQYFGEAGHSESSDESKGLSNDSGSSFIEDQFFGKDADTNFPVVPGEPEQNQMSDGKFPVKKNASNIKASLDSSNANKNFSFIDEEFFGHKTESPNQTDLQTNLLNSDNHHNSDFYKTIFKRKKERQDAAEAENLTEAELHEPPPLSAEAPEVGDAPEQVALKMDPLEFARQQQQRDEELLAPLEGEGALAAGQVSALEYALAFRRRSGINLNLSPGESFFQRYIRGEKPFPEWRKPPQDSYEALEMEAKEEERRRAEETKFVPVDVTPPWSAMTSCEIVSFLKRCVIYEDEHVLAINKPYGLPCQGMNRDLFSLLPDLSAGLRLPQLLPVHRLDTSTTGALLFAKHEEAARRVKKQFSRREVLKRYVALVKGVPSNKRGVVQTPIAQLHDPVLGITKSVLVPSDEITSVERGRRKLPLVGKKAAVTAYQVLVSKHQTSLLVLEPSTGVRHQLRVHLADGLGCPLLGDHKYSTASGKKPQQVAPALEQHLGMARPKARHLMLHLHCLGLSLAEQEPLGIYAQPHFFFLRTLNRIGFVLPSFLRRMRPLI